MSGREGTSGVPPPEDRPHDPSRPPGARGGESREIIFEFTPVGGSVRVTAVDVDTGMEVVIVGPASASQSDLQRVAVQKLHYRLTQEAGGGNKNTKPPGPRGGEGGGGILV